jgi:uncharacterized protein with ParB-like and HNH nuclease domain
MDTSASNRRLRVLLTAIGNGSLVPQPEFQRRLVWTNKDKVEFIRTVLEGYPFPEIYIAAGYVDTKTGEGAEVLVDGQQRITSLYQYFKGSADLRLPPDIPKYENLESKLDFLEYKVVVRDLGNMNIEQIKQIFQRINSTSYGLNSMEIHNARYGGEFKEVAEQISQLEFFEMHKVFTNTDIKRMNDVLFCASLVATVMSAYFNRDRDIELFFAKYNEFFPAKEEILRNTNEVLFFISEMDFPLKSRAFKKADFFTLFVELYILLINNKAKLDISSSRAAIDELFQGVELASSGGAPLGSKAERYYKAALQASNDRGSRIERGKLVREVLLKYHPTLETLSRERQN